MNQNNIFPQRLRELRLATGETQRQVSENVGVIPATLSAYEKGVKNPTIDTIKKIAIYFDVSVDWLLGLSDNKNTERFTTYADVTKSIIELLSFYNCPCYAELIVPNMFIDEMSKGISLVFHDDIISTFLGEYKKIWDLYTSGTIDEGLYKIWLEKQFSIHEKIEISKNGIREDGC